MCMAESLPCSPETITTLLISYAPIKNKKFNAKKKKKNKSNVLTVKKGKKHHNLYPILSIFWSQH